MKSQVDTVAHACNPALRRMRHEDPREFKASLGYSVRLYLNNKENNNKNRVSYITNAFQTSGS